MALSQEDVVNILKKVSPEFKVLRVYKTNNQKVLDIEFAGVVFKNCRWTHLRVGKKPYKKTNLPPGIYSLWSKCGDCLYVGKTTDMNARMSFHKRADYGSEVSKVSVMWFENLADWNILEPYLVNTLSPKYNKEFMTGSKPSFTIQTPEWNDFTTYWDNIVSKASV